MVAISLYKGNLHRVPDVPRRWLVPTPKISLKDFRTLLLRRSRALARLGPAPPTSSPNPSTDPLPPFEPPLVLKEEEESQGAKEPDQLIERSSVTPVVEEESNVLEKEEKAPVPMEPSSQTTNKNDVANGNEKENRRKEIEEKLQILNAKKHNLVQVLKQILNAEDELKKRSSMQGIVSRPPLPLQVDVTSDSVSMTRLNTPKTASNGSLPGESEGVEADCLPNHNIQSRHFPTSSPSRSSDSLHRKPSYSVPVPTRSASGVSASPSRFAPTGQHGQPLNLPSLSVSGTCYAASSPSPAASGGTSVLRDGRTPSPWN